MRSLLAVLLLIVSANITIAADIKPVVGKDQAAFFEGKIRPLLATHCYKCHGARKQEGEFRIDSLKSLLKGGESGAAVVPGEPSDSLLVEAINYESYEMPPDKQLDKASIALLTKWVKMGAPWPQATAKPFDWSAFGKMKFTSEDRAFWFFQPVKNPAVPEVKEAR